MCLDDDIILISFAEASDQKAKNFEGNGNQKCTKTYSHYYGKGRDKSIHEDRLNLVLNHRIPQNAEALDFDFDHIARLEKQRGLAAHADALRRAG